MGNSAGYFRCLVKSGFSSIGHFFPFGESGQEEFNEKFFFLSLSGVSFKSPSKSSNTNDLACKNGCLAVQLEAKASSIGA